MRTVMEAVAVVYCDGCCGRCDEASAVGSVAGRC